MKSSEFKKLIKDSVREAIKEELKDILLEALKTNKNTISENKPISSAPPASESDKRKAYMDIISSMSRNGDTVSFTTNDMQFTPTPVDTFSEGSSLPSGELSLNQILSLTKSA